MGRWQLCLDAPSWVVICSVLRTLKGVNTLTIISVFCLAFARSRQRDSFTVACIGKGDDPG